MTFTLMNASAGSGKTYALTHEIADRITAGLQPSQLIATTFTRKAAAELSDRIRRTLLDQGLVEEARGTDSALIGTVNSVAGRVLSEYAIDAGLSPDLRELDEDGQKRAFAAAIDATAADRAATARGLLARLEHDGTEDDSRPFAHGPIDWQQQVRDLTTAARSNLIDAAAVRAAITTSWESYRATADLPAPAAEDHRPQWVSLVRTAIADGRAALESGIYTDADGETKKIGSNSAAPAERGLDALELKLRTLTDHERCPWSAWVRIASIATGAGETAKGATRPKKVYGAVLDHILFPAARRIGEELLANPVLQADLEGLIALVLGTAADALDAYEEHKRRLGLIDFVDQEVLALRLLQHNPRVQESIRSRFRLLAVDEFQDTSPVQLALFLQLSRLVEDKIWVGDPKQAIYGFRGADPELMDGVIAALGSGGTVFGRGEVRDLHHSWRSTAAVLELSNTLFSRVFDQLPPDRVRLDVPEQRREQARGGRVEVWQAIPEPRKSQDRHAAAIASGVRDLLEDGAAPREIAVLARKNTQVDAVRAALSRHGIPASGAAPSLQRTREGQILGAGLAAALDASDTLAVTELVSLLADHHAHRSWFDDLAQAPDREARRAVIASWWQDDALAGLRAVRTAAVSLTPIEMIDALIDALDLPRRIAGWSDPAGRRRTLDAVRTVARSYTDETAGRSEPVTLSGLRAALEEATDGAKLSEGEDAVWVGTVHAAKGLEWPHVVVMLSEPRPDPHHALGVVVLPADRVDVTDPLAGRRLHYWPKVLTGLDPLQEDLDASDIARRRRRDTRAEVGRLHYVALTRAARVGVLCAQPGATSLDELVESDEPLVTWGDESVVIAGAQKQVPAHVRQIPGDLEAEVTAWRAPVQATLVDPEIPSDPARSAARFRASGVETGTLAGTVRVAADLGTPLVQHGERDWTRVGEVVHAYLALPLAQLDAAQRREAADRLRSRWLVERALPTDAVLEAGERWLGFLAREFADAEQLTEQPITWWNEDSQGMEGWIDALLRRPDGGLVLVDHKTYTGGDVLHQMRERYLGQMHTYARALEAAGSAPSRILLHLPLRGDVLEVHLEEPA